MIHQTVKSTDHCLTGKNKKVNLSNYATKADLKNATGADISKLAAKSDLASLKAEIDKLDVDKLENIPTNLSNSKVK